MLIISALVNPCDILDPKHSASALARLRHKPNYEKADAVRQYWRDNIDPLLSAQKAAEHVFSAGVTDLSYKTIAEVISALRKEEGLRKK